ncbi:tail fiber assembly protein [Salmonella enterica subsp. enterica serovar Telelkebir]|nr:tail fiber assembly protein [Salmonella enterica subsp. enterica serovar Telelkebir]ECC3295663.1 tail fiber assembly protein [Salmonella enterica subsp. enterica]EDR2888318.1 tail fiber assembly protein [Salmonella enterica subsp. enterica]EDR6140839.1 tail fiber assembly protein [Salmonella enterica subsp. enterica]EDU9860161.1 tail fiber assembly protein [Salmonella enterica subsp. enterica]
MELLNLTRYTPGEPKYGLNAVYLIDENGLDWYDSQDKFEKKFKLAIKPDGVLVSLSEDISMLFPLDLSVVETDTLPDDFTEQTLHYGAWKWDGAAVVAVSAEPLLQTTRKTAQELSLEAYALQCAVDAGTASDEQVAELAAQRSAIAAMVGQK